MITEAASLTERSQLPPGRALGLGTVTMNCMGRDGQRGVLGTGICNSATVSPWPGSEGKLATCLGADHSWAQPSALGAGV